jgi:hypothetical protein
MTALPHLAQEMARAGALADARSLCVKLTENARRRLLGNA